MDSVSYHIQSVAVQMDRGKVMSLTIDGRFIHCDGEGCTSVARIPVGLRNVLSRSGSPESVRGWLFINRGDRTLHLCPRCIASYDDESEESAPTVGEVAASVMQTKRTIRRATEAAT